MAMSIFSWDPGMLVFLVIVVWFLQTSDLQSSLRIGLSSTIKGLKAFI